MKPASISILISVVFILSFTSCEKMIDDLSTTPRTYIIASDIIEQELVTEALRISDDPNTWLNFDKDWLFDGFGDILIRFATHYDYLSYNIFFNSYIGNDPNAKPISFLEWSTKQLEELENFMLNDKEWYNVAIKAYTTSRVAGDVSITADTRLFGEEPGTNLKNHFKMVFTVDDLPKAEELDKDSYLKLNHNIHSHCYNGCVAKSSNYIPVLCPPYPTNIDEFFFTDSVIFSSNYTTTMRANPHWAYYITLKDYPEEQPDKFNLTISIPVKRQLIREAFCDDGSFDPDKIKEDECIMSGTVEIRFR